MKNKKRTFILFCCLQLTYWACFASFISYFVALMLSTGMSNTTISLIQAVYLMLAFLGSFFWGGLSDKLRTNRKTFMLQIVIGAIIGVLIYQFRYIPLLVAVLYPVLGFCYVPVASNLDAWIIKSFPGDPDYYGTTRAVSALGFGVLCLIMGQLVSRVGYFLMPIGLSIFAALSFLIALLQPDSPISGLSMGQRFSVKQIGGLVKNKSYLSLIVILLLTGLAIVPLNNMKLIFYQSVGGDAQWIGFESMVGCSIQFPFFMAAGKLKKIPSATRLLISESSVLMLLLAFWAANRPWIILTGSIFYYIGYSILLPTYREMGAEGVDPKLLTTAQSLLDAVFGSLAGMAGLLYAGYVIDSFGTKVLALSSIAIFAFVLAMVFIRFLKERNPGKRQTGSFTP